MVRLKLSPGDQGPPTTMKALTTWDKKCWYLHSMVSFQERFTYISLIKSASMRYKELSPHPQHTDKETKSRCGAKTLAGF